jgi:hypothetical protein
MFLRDTEREVMRQKGIVGGEIIAAKVDPEKFYTVNYTIDHAGAKHYGRTNLLGRYLTENQISELHEQEQL